MDSELHQNLIINPILFIYYFIDRFNNRLALMALGSTSSENCSDIEIGNSDNTSLQVCFPCNVG